MSPATQVVMQRDIRMKQTTYTTTDSNSASFLLASGLALVEVSRIGNNVAFTFDDSSDRAEALVLQYASNVMAPVRAFADAQKTLKTLIFRQEGRR